MNDPALLQVSSTWPHLVAAYCALLLPLVAGLPPIIAIMESVHVMTEREIWKQLARFWAVPFRISLLLAGLGALLLLAVAVADALRPGGGPGSIAGLALSGLIVAVLCIEAALLARFMHADWLVPNLPHLVNTWLLVVMPVLALLGVALVYGWMDSPVATGFDPANLRLRVTDVPAWLANPAAQVKFVHLTGAAYLTAVTCVLAVSAWYLLRGRNTKAARCSITVAASFGLAAAISLAVLGDVRGYTASPGQKMRVAAIAAEWQTQSAPAPFTLVGLPDTATQTTHGALALPWLLGLGATHSWRKPVAGITELRDANVARIRAGAAALAMARSRSPERAAPMMRNATVANAHAGYGLLLVNHGYDPAHPGSDAVAAAARDTVPNVPLLFWSFRGMALAGLWCIVLFAAAFWFASRRELHRRGFLRAACWSLPLPWLAGALGWIVAEAGRGPWLVDGVLPLIPGRTGWQVALIDATGGLLLAALAVIGVVWLARALRAGPDGLRFWAADPGRH